jgi:predicted Rossmann fold nucleotide-binding protein DprA/Smf involved in DNA uptake
MDTTELILLLSEVPGIGDRTLAGILRKNSVLRRSPEEFLCLSPEMLRDEYDLLKKPAACVAAITPALKEAASATARSLRRAGVTVVTLLDAVYPARLLERLDDPPSVLYAYGNLALLESRLFAVANSNGIPDQVLSLTDQAAEAALEAGWWPVTGHNRPAYQRPALVSRRMGGRVCYVLDRGILEAFGGDLSKDLFPAARIWSPAYDPACDLTISPFALSDHSLATHNRRRDEIVFALADIVLAGVVKPGGQMEKVCLTVLKQGRKVVLMGPAIGAADGLIEAGAVNLDPQDTGALRPLLH